MEKKIELLMSVAVLVCACILARAGAQAVSHMKAEKGKNCIVIDAGHGGTDPGKVGVNDALEKDINLSIALKLQELLEKEGLEIVLTRDSDEGLYDEGVDNKKVQDMQRRCELIAKERPVFTISIHQNSYTDASVSGAQCFYFGQSEEGKILAQTLQKIFQEEEKASSSRQAKANETYYLLKRSASPTVIVECGFLSNPGEAELLITEDYQQEMAQLIKKGIMCYLGDETLNSSTESLR